MEKRVLGIDPGTIRTGYALLEENNQSGKALTWGAVTNKRNIPVEKRLLHIYNELDDIMKLWKPTVVAVEEPFFGTNARSAIAIGQAQAIAFLVTSKHDLPLFKYAPSRIKVAVSNYGLSNKKQMQELVKIQLSLKEIPEPDDAADALAICICHIRNQNELRLLGQGIDQ
jgi:crossover junction endodeoxyribonuclease RuvC